MNNMLNKIKNYKETIFAVLFMIACLLLYSFFPTRGISQETTSFAIFFIVFPLLFWKIIQKRNLGDLGLRLGDWKKGIFFSSISLVFSFTILFILLKAGILNENYSVPKIFTESFFLFLIYEFFVIGFFFLCFSFFFNGFFMSSIEKEFGDFSPLLGFIVFLFFIFFSGNLNWAFSFLIINVFFGGFIAQKSHSLIYPIVSGLLFSLIADSIVIKFLI